MGGGGGNKYRDSKPSTIIVVIVVVVVVVIVVLVVVAVAIIIIIKCLSDYEYSKIGPPSIYRGGRARIVRRRQLLVLLVTYLHFAFYLLNAFTLFLCKPTSLQLPHTSNFSHSVRLLNLRTLSYFN